MSREMLNGSSGRRRAVEFDGSNLVAKD